MIFFLLLKRPQVGSQYPFDELDVKKKIDTRLSVKLHYKIWIDPRSEASTATFLFTQITKARFINFYGTEAVKVDD